MFDLFIFCRGSGCSKDRTAADYGEVGRGSNDWFGLHASGLSIMLTTNETSNGTRGNRRPSFPHAVLFIFILNGMICSP